MQEDTFLHKIGDQIFMITTLPPSPTPIITYSRIDSPLGHMCWNIGSINHSHRSETLYSYVKQTQQQDTTH